MASKILSQMRLSLGFIAPYFILKTISSASKKDSNYAKVGRDRKKKTAINGNC